MSNLIVVLGESGTGKSTSMRHLNPESTVIFNVLQKPLPMRGYRRLFSEERKNYLESDDYNFIIKCLHAINERRPEIKIVVIDDFSFLMNNEFMRRARETGYGKFTEMGLNMFEIMSICTSLRPDLHIYLMCHTEKDHTGIIKPKTVGKMTGDYVGIAERVAIVLHSQVIDRQYKFLTQNDGVYMAKSPMEMFTDLYIDNDLSTIDEEIRKYFNDDMKGIEEEEQE